MKIVNGKRVAVDKIDKQLSKYSKITGKPHYKIINKVFDKYYNSYYKFNNPLQPVYSLYDRFKIINFLNDIGEPIPFSNLVTRFEIADINILYYFFYKEDKIITIFEIQLDQDIL